MDNMPREQILKLICDNTGKRINLPNFTLEELEDFAKAVLCASAATQNAERYQWLREQHWHNSNMCVVINPKAQVKLGTQCPSLDRLDILIDEARGKK